MNIKRLTNAVVAPAAICLAIGLSACSSATSQGLSSRQFDNPAAKSGNAKSQPSMDSVPVLDLALSVNDAYAAIPHRRTAMDFAASNAPDQDKRYLEVAFHLIDQAIRLRVTAYQKFSRTDGGDPQLISDLDRVIDFLQNVEAPAHLTSYHQHLIQGLSDQRAFFAEWQTQGQQFQFGSPDKLGSHPKIQSASTALREAYQILMQEYPGEGAKNKDAFFDYHCALDFI